MRADRQRGALALSVAALGTLGSLLDGWSCAPERASRSAALEVARILARTQPAMGPFLRWSADWRRFAGVEPAPARLRDARAWLRRESHRLRNETTRLARTARQRFPERAHHVVTLSRSDSVLRALTSVPRARRPLWISVLESRPGGEGRRFVRDLRAAGLDARVVPDRAGPEIVQSADLLLIGADTVLPDGAVVHKVGTRPLALAASRARVPLVVVAGTSKFIEDPRRRPRLSPLFDLTPGRLVTEYWTDTGSRRGRGGWPSRRRRLRSLRARVPVRPGSGPRAR